MKKYIFSLCSLVLLASSLQAQPIKQILKQANKNIVSQRIKHAVKTNKAMRNVTPGGSVIGYFHGAGSGKWTELEAAIPPLQVPQTKTKGIYKRSRASLELELSAYGFQAHVLEKYSREEMEQLLASYNAFKSVQDVPSRYVEDFQQLSYKEQILQLKNWAKAQPDFFEDNYLNADEMVQEHTGWTYTPPFHPQINKLRVLVVRDDMFGVESLLDASHKYTDVTIQLVYDAQEAKRLLEEKSFDIVLTDFVLGNDHNGFEVAMHVWNKKLNIPVILYSATPLSPYLLIKYNIVGELDPVTFADEGKQVLNFLSNIVATGKAYPNL